MNTNSHSNFSFLEEYWPELSEIGEQAEAYLFSDASACMMKIGVMGERIINYIFHYENIEIPYDSRLVNRIRVLEKEGLFPQNIEVCLYSIRKARNEADHEGKGTTEQAKGILRNAYTFASWFMEVYGDPDYIPAKYSDPEDISSKDNYAEILKEHELQIKKLSEEIDKLKLVSINEPEENEIKLLPSSTRIADTNLSVRSKNGLQRANLYTLADIANKTAYELSSIRNLGKKSVEEILYLQKYIFNDDKYLIEKSTEEDNNSYSTKDILLKRYFEIHDSDLKSLGYNERIIGLFNKSGIEKLSQLAVLTDDEIKTIKGIGSKKAEDIIKRRNDFVAPIIQKIDNGEINESNYSEPTDSEVDEQTINLLISKSAEHLPIQEILYQLPEFFTMQKLSLSLGRLLQKNKVVLNEDGTYSLYLPKFREIVNKLNDKKGKSVLLLRLEGKTLDEIGKDKSFSCSRERVRQIQDRAIKSAKILLLDEYKLRSFAEDRYKNLFMTFNLSRQDVIEYMGIDQETYSYLKMAYTPKKNYHSIKDYEKFNLNEHEKRMIQKCLYHNTILVDGVRVEKTLTSIERYLIETKCKETTNLEDLFKIYNAFIVDNHLSNNAELLLADDKKRTRENKIQESANVLWTYGKNLRYYDIQSYDLSNLYNSLQLDNYHDIELSSQLFFDMYPELMREYDIRNEYELHNLLKKTIQPDLYPDIKFGRQPTIQFGKIDRDYYVFSTMVDMAPVSRSDLLDALHEETGFDQLTITGSWMKCIDEYFNRGIYDVNDVSVDNRIIMQLSEKLIDDFYLLSEIRSFIAKTNLFTTKDQIPISKLMHQLGWKVNKLYVYRNYSSAKEYFRHLLELEDEINIVPLKKRFVGVTDFFNTLYEMKDNYEIIEIDNDRYISYNKLLDTGINYEKIRLFCNEVISFAGEDFFTISSLRNEGFISSLDDYNMSVRFLESLLREDERLRYHITGTECIFRKSQKPISRKEFVIEIIKELEITDMQSLLELLKNAYNIVMEKYEIVYAIENTSIEYDIADGVLIANS